MTGREDVVLRMHDLALAIRDLLREHDYQHAEILDEACLLAAEEPDAFVERLAGAEVWAGAGSIFDITLPEKTGSAQEALNALLLELAQLISVFGDPTGHATSRLPFLSAIAPKEGTP